MTERLGSWAMALWLVLHRSPRASGPTCVAVRREASMSEEAANLLLEAVIYLLRCSLPGHECRMHFLILTGGLWKASVLYTGI